MIGDERVRRRAAIDRLQDRCLDGQEPALVQEPTGLLQHAGTDDEQVAYVGVNRQVGVALPVAALDVAKSTVDDRFARLVHLFFAVGQRLHGLGQESQLGGANGDLTCAGPEDLTLDSDPVAEIEERHQLVALGQAVLAVDITGDHRRDLAADEVVGRLLGRRRRLVFVRERLDA